MLIIQYFPNQVIWSQLFMFSPSPSTLTGSNKLTYAICLNGRCSSFLHQVGWLPLHVMISRRIMSLSGGAASFFYTGNEIQFGFTL
jgi:hypothetical protein